MADQQPILVEEGDDPLAASYPSTGQDTPHGVAKEMEETSFINIDIGDIVLHTCSSTIHSVINGLQLKLDGQDFPFASFTYTPSSLTDKLTPVDWKLLVTENVQSQHIRCHKLQMGDNLPDLIDIFQKAHAVAVVLINTSENGFLDPSFLIGTKKSHFPVLILKKSCGIELLKKVGQCSKDVLAKITVESFVDPVRTLHETGTAPAHTNSDKMAPKEQGRFLQFLKGERSPPFNLKAELKKLIFASGEPQVICEDSVTFTMVMSTFDQYEKYAKSGSSSTEEALKKINRHLAQTFVQDFPFYLVLAYRMHIKPNIYKCDESDVFIRICIERTERMQPQEVASTFLAFLQRSDFPVRFGSENPTSVFHLLQDACLQLGRISYSFWRKEAAAAKPSQNHFYQRFVYNRFLWVSLYLRLHVEHTTMTQSANNVWHDEVIKAIVHLPMDRGMVAEVKNGLEFGQQVNLPSNLTFSLLLLTKLFASDGIVRPFQHLSHYLSMLESYFSRQDDFLFFVTTIRAEYEPWLKQPEQSKLFAFSVQKTLTGTLQEGLSFVDTLYKFCTEHQFNPDGFHPECKKWVLLLLQLVDVTGDDHPEVHLQRFLNKSTHTVVVKKYREDIINHVIGQTRTKFPQLTLQKFFPLYKAFPIWPNQFLEEYLRQYTVPFGVRISDGTWNELFSEVVKRFSGAQHHHYLLDFLQSVAEHYCQECRAGDLVVDLLKLDVPKLFAVEGGEEKDEEVRRKFSAFLRSYILRCSLQHTILKRINDILSAISDKQDEFQQLVLEVIHREMIPDFKLLQQKEFVQNSPLYSVLHETVTTLCKDFNCLQALTIKQDFYWGIVASCCEKIHVTREKFDWVHLYASVVTCLGSIYNSYCKKRNLPEDECLLSADGFPHEIAHSHSKHMKRYFGWVCHVQTILLGWKQKFMEQRIDYYEILTYASLQQRLECLAQTVCASSSIVDSQDMQAVKSMFLSAFEQLNALLIKYIPGEPDAKWCTLPSLLRGHGVALPPNLLDPISQHIVFPGEKKAGELLKSPLPPHNSGIFQPGHDISLKLSKPFSLQELSILVKGLETFLQPIMDVLDVIVFFKLHPSKMFDKYLHVYLSKANEPETMKQRTTTTLSYTASVFPPINMQEDQSAVEGVSLHVLHSAINSTRELVLKLMQGTAAYSEIVAEGELDLENLNIAQEFNVLQNFSAYLKPPLASFEGLAGVQSILELFQYVHHIRSIHSVCEQYQLKGCLEDPELVKLRKLAEDLTLEENRDNLTPVQAFKEMEMVKKTLCLASEVSPSCLELLKVVGDSVDFYQFVRDKWFAGKQGQAMFQQQYQLVTAQLQHEEYDETVLNHLYAAFKLIEPFMDTHQGFQQLMSQVTSLDVTNGMKQLQTVNTNITLIQLWFSRAEGDTLENVANELDCIITTGKYLFFTPETSNSMTELILEYSPSPSCRSLPSHPLPTSQHTSLEDSESAVNMQHWNSEQIRDFVRKLGFLDTEKEGGDKIKHFLHVNETAYKLLDLSVQLRELGHPQYIENVVNKSLNCAIKREEADQRVHDTNVMLNTWMQRVAELRSQYDWLLFFSVPKLLRLYHLLRDENPNLEAIMHEISFLCSNEQAAWESALEMVQKSHEKCYKHIKSDNIPMHVVGEFLGMVFNNHSLPKRCGGSLTQSQSITRLSLSTEPTQMLHYCPGYSQAQLIRLIVSIYNGVPEAFEVLHCHPSSTEEEVGLFMERVAKHPLQYLVLEINRLPFKLQEYMMQLHLVIQKMEVKITSKSPCLHFVETAPSVLRKMPWVTLKEHMESGPHLNFEKARKICLPQVVKLKDFACVQLVYGHAGDGKTHYIKQHLATSPANCRLTIAVNEAFTPLNAISKLRTLPLNQKNCAIFFNFTMLPPGESVDESEQTHHQQLMEVIAWFFFDLLMLGYVEDSDTGLSFRIPGGMAWAVYVEVPSHDHNVTPEEALKHFQQEVPALGLLGTPYYIKPDTPYTVDEEVQLVCKYLKALQIDGEEGIDRLYKEVGPLPYQPVKFSSKPDLQVEECQQLLLQYMPEHFHNTKITQRLFVKYMNRRCSFLDTLAAFNFNMGEGEYVTNEQGKQVCTDTKQLGSTLMTTMLREVKDFCDPDIKRNWSLKPHQQLIYDFKDGGGSLGLISLHPEKLSEQDRTKFKKIGVSIPSVDELYSRELLDGYLSRALGVELENKRLTLIDNSAYVLTMDYTIKMLNMHERYQCGVPVIIEGETGVGKTALVEMLSKLWNNALLMQWKRQRSRLLDLMQRELQDISPVFDNYQVCVQTMEMLIAGQHVPKENLVLLGQLPHGRRQLYSVLLSFLLPMRCDPVVTLLTLQKSQQEEVSLEKLFKKADEAKSVESTASLLYGLLFAQIKPTFHKLNVHAAMTPADIWNYLNPVFMQAKKLKEAFMQAKKLKEAFMQAKKLKEAFMQAKELKEAFTNKMVDSPSLRVPFVTVFLDEVNTSSCLGLFKEIIVDRTLDGNPIPDNIFIVGACNPHRGNSLASHNLEETWVRGAYYVRQLHPTLHFLMWDYGSLDEHQERDYISAKMKVLNRQMPSVEVANLTDLIVTSQSLMRSYAFQQLRSNRLDKHQAKISSHSCVSQRDIQRVFTFYQWMMDSYTKYQPYGKRQDYSRRAVLVALGIVYYMRLNSKYRERYKEYMDKQVRMPNEVNFSQAFSDELDWYIEHVELPTGIARTQALKENLFVTIVCTVTHTPLIIVGAPGSSKTLSFNLAIANLKGQESKKKLFRDISVFRSLDPHFYQCSRRTTSIEIQTVFSRAINRQRSHSKFNLPIYCVVFMDEAGLPEESHESLKVLHYHLDQKEVSFVAITNHVLDAAKTNRAVSLFRPEASEEDLKTLAKGCLCTDPDNPPPELKKDLEMIVGFCPAYSHLMTKPEFSQYFGLRDFIHFVNYLRRHRNQMLTSQLVMKAMERNFNGSSNFDKICNTFLNKLQSSVDQVRCRSILEVLQDSLEDRPQKEGWDMAEAEVRYKLIIDPSEDDSLIRLLFFFGVLQRKETRMFACSDFPGDSQLQKINTIAAIRHSAIEGHTVLMTQTDDIHESFYDLFNQRFRRIDDPQKGARYYTNIAIGAHLKPSRVDPNFQCVVVIKKSEVKNTPAPFLNRFEKYCITHHSLLEEALSRLSPCIRIIMEAAMEKVQDFIDLISGPNSLYGLQPETLDSLVLSMLPPLTHSYKSLKEPRVINDSLDLKMLLMQELLQDLCLCAGLHVPLCTSDELHLDTDCLFDMVLCDPEFEGLLPKLSHSSAVEAVVKTMDVLHNAPAPQDGPAQLPPEGCLVVALLQQWLVRHLCKQIMQLMTSEAFILYRNMLPSSYLENYISFHAHFSLQKIILKYHQALENSRGNPASSPTKLLCFTRSSPLIHQLPAQYPSSVFEAQVAGNAQQTLHDLVFANPSQLVVCKLSNILTQSSVQQMLKGFVQSDTAQVCLLIANMQETSQQVVNHLRIMIEEAEMHSTQQAKLFVMLLHFPPAQFFDPCYPSLFLKGWDHCYLDTVAHSTSQGVVNIRDWLWRCCFPKKTPLPPQKDSLVLALKEILPEAISILSSRMFFGSSREGSFNQPMNGSQRSKDLRELLFKKGVGEVLCEKFCSYWKPAVMAEYLDKAATFTNDRESTLNLTDSVQTMFKSLFFDFLVYLLSRINEEFNIDILFDYDCTPAVQKLFLDILRLFPLPKLSQLHVLSTSLTVPTPKHSPRFPFFKIVCEAVERIVEQSHEDTNVKLDLLQEEKAESIDSTPFRIYDHLQEAVRTGVEGKMKTIPKESLVLAVDAMGLHSDLWQRYFDDFLLHKLQLGGLRGGAISQQILSVFFSQLHEQEAMSRVVSLHCYFHINHLGLAKMANILRPLNQIQQTVKPEPHMLTQVDPEREPHHQLVSAVNLTNAQNVLGTPQHIAAFVVNTLFNAIVGATFGKDISMENMPEKMTVWFKAYRDVMALSTLKQQVYAALELQEGGTGEDGMGMNVVEARLNVMQAVFLAIQTSSHLETDILVKGLQIFHALFNNHFTETLKLKGNCPHLAEVTSVTVEVITFVSPDISSVRLLMEGLFAHFFSPYRRGYHTEDIQWFLQLANEQEQWKANHLNHAQKQKQLKPVTGTQVPRGAITMCVFKLYMGHILGSCDQSDAEAALSGPLLLYHHQPRSEVGRVLITTPDLGSPAHYIPTFYQECSFIIPTANHENQRMQQPLAHLYFLTLLEHLQACEHKLSGLVRIANSISQQCASPATGEMEAIVLRVELQAVLQVILQELATYLDPTELRMGEIQPLKDDINRLLDDVETGGGDTKGHGMVLALHMVKQLKSSQKFSELLTKHFDYTYNSLHCLQPFHEEFAVRHPLEPKLHLLPFMLPSSEGTELGALYLRVRRVMVEVHEGKEQMESLVHIADECTKMNGNSPLHLPIENDARVNAVGKSHCFRMMVWLCAYYDFYNEKITSELLCNMMGNQLAPYLQEEGYVRLIQCFLNPKLLLSHPESPNPLQDDTPVLELVPGGGHRRLERGGKKIDPLYLLFMPNEHQQNDQSDTELRHSLANLLGVVLGCPTHSNHLWYHLFHQRELHGTYLTGFMYDAKINSDGLLYDCGVELSPEGQFGRQDYVKHATRGTYTLHSLYLLLWANFGTFCMALLTQPEAETNIHGPIISEWLSVRHYCVSQLCTVWMHMRNNLGLSNEEQSFLVMRYTNRLYELFKPGTTAQGCLRGVFKTCQELDSYEKMWHTHIYQPSWGELKTEFAQYSQFWLNKLFVNIRHLGLCYPHFPTERDFIHSVLSSGDIQSHAKNGDLYLLGRFAQEWPRLQAGGLLLPDLLEFYHWLHTALAHLVTCEKATTLPIGHVVKLAVQRYSKAEGEHLQALYNRVKDGYNKYVELIGGAIGAGPCAALRQGNKIYTIADDIPLLYFLSDVVDEEEGNDWLYTVVADIIAAHNAFIEGVYFSVQAQQQSPLARLLPDEPAKVYPSEVNDSNCIVGKFRSHHGINEFLQLVRSRYQPSSEDVAMKQHISISPTLLQTVKAPEFQLSLLQEDIVAYFLAGKPLICTEPSSLVRTPFKFRQFPSSITAAGHATDVVGSVLDMDITEKLPDTFKVPLEETLQKRLEYEFHSASYHTMMEVVTGLRTVSGHLLKALMEQKSEGLEENTVSQFLLMLYNHLKQSGEVLKEIGISSTSPSQMTCLVELPLPSLFFCLQLFTSWVRDGVYDFATLPFGVKTPMSYQDLQSIQQIPLKWTRSSGELLEEIKQMIEVLKHSETHVIKTANDSAHKPIMQYFKENHFLGEEDHLPSCIPTSILIQHYTSFRTALRRLVLTVQKQQKVEAVEGATKKEQWREVVGDLWDKRLRHLRKGVYIDVYDPRTQQFGFQVGSVYDRENSLMDDFMKEPSLESIRKKEKEHARQPGDNDIQTLEQSAQDCTSEHVGQFLEGIGLGDHVAAFSEQDISGEELLELDQETLKELGVTSAVERLKIKVLFQRSLQGGVVQYPLQTVLDFLKQYKLDKYCDTFQDSDMDGDLLLKADDSVLRELGVTSATERLKIKILFQHSLQGGVLQYPLQTVVAFLKQYKLDKYSETFQQWDMNGDLLLEADDSVLKEMGVSSSAERTRIKTKYKTFVKNQL